MIIFTDAAQEKIAGLMSAEDKVGKALRLQIIGRGPGGFQYAFRIVPQEEKTEQDTVVETGAFRVFIDAKSAPDLEGATVDYLEDSFQRGFMIDNPNPVWKDPTAQAIQEILDTRVNPGMAGHGGFVSLLEFKDDTAYIAFGGGCQGCGLVDVTLRQGVEVMLKEALPQVKKVVDTTNHDAGVNPFYKDEKQGESPLA